jgi:APA family basic amino acid/polyamine antiporter
VNARTQTPIVTTMITGVIVAAVAALVPLTSLLKLVNIGTFSAFVIVCAGVMVLRFTHPGAARPFRVPFGPVVVPAAGIALCAWLTLEGLDRLTWLRFIVWFAAGLIVYALYGYHSSLLRERR